MYLSLEVGELRSKEQIVKIISQTLKFITIYYTYSKPQGVYSTYKLK